MSPSQRLRVLRGHGLPLSARFAFIAAIQSNLRVKYALVPLPCVTLERSLVA
jgi:hypothetical protein